jgi:hypothetical protein
MDDLELMLEVLQLTLACQSPGAAPEERARLERLLADHPQAIVWYLRVVDDTLTLMDAAAANQSAAELPGCTLAPKVSAATTARRSRSPVSPRFSGGQHRKWLAMTVIACVLLVTVSAALWRPAHRWLAFQSAPLEADVARVVDVSNVAWAQGAAQYNEWAQVRPGETLKFQAGWLNLFLSGGAELLIEGPADVDYLSSQRVFARQGKLAARVGPGATGFRIDTPHANVIDRGTAFGVTVDGRRQTSVVV